MRNPPWSREEVILALDLYASVGAATSDSPKVVALSELLRSRPGTESLRAVSSFRNPNGVSLKLGNFAFLDPEYSGTGMTSCSKMDRSVWDEFANAPIELRKAARSIRRAWS